VWSEAVRALSKEAPSVLTGPDIPRSASGTRFGSQGVGEKGEKDGDAENDASAALRALATLTPREAGIDR
jgi:hypothetical protein